MQHEGSPIIGGLFFVFGTQHFTLVIDIAQHHLILLFPMFSPTDEYSTADNQQDTAATKHRNSLAEDHVIENCGKGWSRKPEGCDEAGITALHCEDIGYLHTEH